MDTNQRKNFIARCFVQAGYNKDTIIGILANALHEDSSLDPTQEEIGAGYKPRGGIGIFQFTSPDNAIGDPDMPATKIYNAIDAGASEEDLIKMQVGFVCDFVDNQWDNYWTDPNGQEFKTNSLNRSPNELANDFEGAFERPAVITDRGDFVNMAQDGLTIDGGPDEKQPDQPDGTGKGKDTGKYVEANPCASMSGAQHGPSSNNENPQSPPSSGGSGDKNFDKAMTFWQALIDNNVQYSQPQRNEMFNHTFADCSSAVSAALAFMFNDGKPFWGEGQNAPNTQTLFTQWLPQLGFKKVAQRPATTRGIPGDITPGDIILWTSGEDGSMGDGSDHVMMYAGDSESISCFYSGGTLFGHSGVDCIQWSNHDDYKDATNGYTDLSLLSESWWHHD